MPKSKQRKDHKKKVASYKKRVLDQRKAFEKKMTMFYQQQQEAMLEEQIKNQQSPEGQNLEGLNIEDFGLGDELETQLENSLNIEEVIRSNEE